MRKGIDISMINLLRNATRMVGALSVPCIAVTVEKRVVIFTDHHLVLQPTMAYTSSWVHPLILKISPLI